MELLDGETLQQRLTRGALEVSAIIEIGHALADALAAAHEHGIIHRDLKPANIFLASRGPKILDFGVAKKIVGSTHEMSTSAALTHHGETVGTVAYMSPEQLQGKDVDARSDLFSFGLVLYEMATGRPAFTGPTSAVISGAILHQQPIAPSHIRSDLDPRLEHIILKALEKDRENRHQSAADLRADFKRLRSSIEGTPGGTPVFTTPRSQLSSAVAASSATQRAGLRGMLALVLGIGIAGLAMLGVVTYSRTRASAPSPANPTASDSASPTRRVVVATFDNRTGDAALASLGSQIADRLIQAVDDTGLATVSPIPAPVNGTQEREPVTLITGVYYLQGDSVEIQARVLEMPSGTLLHAFDPITGLRSSPQTAFDVLRQRVMGAIATHFGGALEDLPFVSHVPSYDAYREFASGLEFFFSEPAVAQQNFHRALALDPDFFDPRFYSAVAYSNVGNPSEAVQMVQPLVEHRDRLTPFERNKLDWFTAFVVGRRTAALAAILEAQKLNPHSRIVNYLAAQELMRLNRVRPALELLRQRPALSTSNPRGLAGSGGSQGIASGLNATATAEHLLGDFDGELRDAREAARLVPQSITYKAVESRALIAMGRVDEALEVVEASLALPGADGAIILLTALELRAHGQRQKSIQLANQAVDWYRNRAAAGPATASGTVGIGRALYAAERWSEALASFRDLARRFPDQIEYHGRLGVLAARQADQASAAEEAEWLRKQSRPYLNGVHRLWQARIAAVSGNERLAVDLLRDAFAEGAAYTIDFHRDMDLESLATNSAFTALMRGKD